MFILKNYYIYDSIIIIIHFDGVVGTTTVSHESDKSLENSMIFLLLGVNGVFDTRLFLGEIICDASVMSSRLLLEER